MEPCVPERASCNQEWATVWASTFHLRWLCKYRNGSEADNFASHRGVKDPVVAVPGGSVSGVGWVDEGYWVQTPITVKATRMMTRKGIEGEWCREFGHNTRRTRVQEEAARWETHKSRWAYHAVGKQTGVPSCPAGASCAKSSHDRRYRHTFDSATEGIDVSTR